MFAVVVLLVSLVFDDVSTVAEEEDGKVEDGTDSSVRPLPSVSADTDVPPSVSPVLFAQLDAAIENVPVVIPVVFSEEDGVSAGLQEASTQAAAISDTTCRIYLHMLSPFPAPAVISAKIIPCGVHRCRSLSAASYIALPSVQANLSCSSRGSTACSIVSTRILLY